MIRSLCSFALLAAACGSKSKPTPTEPVGATSAWKDMNADQRHAYMKETVLPQMKEAFVAFDAEEFGEMNCKTCHGPGAEDESLDRKSVV